MAAINITQKAVDILVDGTLQDSFEQRANSADYDISTSLQNAEIGTWDGGSISAVRHYLLQFIQLNSNTNNQIRVHGTIDNIDENDANFVIYDGSSQVINISGTNTFPQSFDETLPAGEDIYVEVNAEGTTNGATYNMTVTMEVVQDSSDITVDSVTQT